MADSNKLDYKSLVDEDGILSGFKSLLEKMKAEITSQVSASGKSLSGNKGTTSADLKKQAQDIEAISASEKSLIQVEKELLKVQKEKEKLEKQLVDASDENVKAKIRYSNASREQRTILQNEIKLATSAEGSYNKLSAQYSLNKIALNAMSEAQRKNTIEGQKLEKQTEDIYAEMNKLQKATGKHVLEVGNYGIATKKVVQNLGEMKTELRTLRNMSFVGKSPDEVAALKLRIGELMDKMGDMKKEMQILGTEKSAVLVGGLKLVAAGVEGVVGALSVMGVESETIKKLESKMTSLIAVTHALAEIEDSISSGKAKAILLRIKDMALKTAETVKTWALTAATTAYNVVVGTSTGALKAFRLALAGTGIGLIIIGIAALVANWKSLTKNIISSNDSLEKATENWAKYEKAINDAKISNDEFVKSLANVTSAYSNLGNKTTAAAGTFVSSLSDIVNAAEMINNYQFSTDSMKEISSSMVTLAADTKNFTEIGASEMINKLDSMNISLTRTDDVTKTVKESIEKAISAFGNLGKSLIEKKEKEKKANEESAKAYKEYLSILNELVKKHRDAHVDLLLEGKEKEKEILKNKYYDELASIELLKIKTEDKEKAKAEAKEIYLANDLLIDKKYYDLAEKNLDDFNDKQLENIIKNGNEKIIAYDKQNDKEKSEIELKYAGNEKLINEKEKELLELELEKLEAHKKMLMDSNQWDLAAYNDYMTQLNGLKVKGIELDKKIDDDKKKTEKELYDAIEETTTAIIESYKKRSEAKEENLNKELEASKEYESQLRELAKKGIEGATENLAFEQKAQAEIEKKKLAEQKKQKRLELGMSAISAFGKIAETEPEQALTKTITEITKLLAFINSLPAFSEGVIEFKGKGTTKSDSNLVRLSDKESVIKAEATEMYKPQLKAMNELRYNPFDYIKLPSKDGMQNNVSDYGVIKEIQVLNETIKNKTEYKIDINGLTHEIVERVTKGNTTIINKHKPKGLF